MPLGELSVEKPSATETSQTQPEVCMRLEMGPSAVVHSPLAVQNGFLQMLIHNYQAELLMSFLTNLGPFLEDEVIPEVIPMKIEIVNTKITLKVCVRVCLERGVCHELSCVQGGTCERVHVAVQKDAISGSTVLIILLCPLGAT